MGSAPLLIANGAVLRAHRRELTALASRHGVNALRVAGPGRLIGRLDEDRDLFDVAEFETAAARLLGFEVSLYSEAVLTKERVSRDLLAATPL